MPSDVPALADTAENITSSELSIFERLVKAQRLLDAAEATVDKHKTIVSALKEAAEIELSSLGISAVKLDDGSRVKVTPFTTWNLRGETKTEFIRLAIERFPDLVTVNSRTAGSFMKCAEPEIQEEVEKYFAKFDGKKVGVSVCG